MVSLIEKMESIKQQKCNICQFESLRTAWFDFGILVNTIHSILLNELDENTSECGDDLLEETGFSNHIEFLLLHSAELMKLTDISSYMDKDTLETMH